MNYIKIDKIVNQKEVLLICAIECHFSIYTRYNISFSLYISVYIKIGCIFTVVLCLA